MSLIYSRFREHHSMTVNPFIFQPVDSLFDTYEERLESYNDWPESCGQSAQTLANAGFYMISSYNCHTKCFNCKGELLNWEPQDIPIEEHIKWFPTCMFASAKKAEMECQKPCNDSGESDDIYEIMKGFENMSVEDVKEKYTDLFDKIACKICYSNFSNILCTPCNHLCICSKCSSRIKKKCPLCRGYLNRKIKVFLS